MTTVAVESYKSVFFICLVAAISKDMTHYTRTIHTSDHSQQIRIFGIDGRLAPEVLNLKSGSTTKSERLKSKSGNSAVCN